jgi:hypothetical protein
MDRLPDFTADHDFAEADDAIDAPPSIGSDERRMHVRAYNHWVSLLDGRAYPSVEDLQPGGNDDFSPHGVLLDFTGGAESPSIAWLGQKLRAECDLPGEADDIADVPPRSLLSRLTDHYLQIIANRAPIGFEAEFVNGRGFNTLYRGILMPLSSDDDSIDFIYGVINWKEVVSGQRADALEHELAAAIATQGPRVPLPSWADGPGAVAAEPAPSMARRDILDDDFGADTKEFEPSAGPVGVGLAEWLAAARASADIVRHVDSRGRAALYHALGQAYDFALLADVRAGEYATLLSDSKIVMQDRAPMTPIAKLVFGMDYDKTRLTEFAAALSYAKRHALPAGGMRHFLDHYPGGLKAVVAAERRERRPEGKPVKPDATRDAARALQSQAMLTLPGDDEFVVLVARRIDGERVGIIGVAEGDKALLDRALKAVTA